MNEQMRIAGVPPVRAEVPFARLGEFSRGIGAVVVLGDVVDELKKVQAEHPKVPGLTLALAVVEKHLAQSQMKNSKLALILAASGGLQVERMATAVALRDDGGIELVSMPPDEDVG